MAIWNMPGGRYVTRREKRSDALWELNWTRDARFGFASAEMNPFRKFKRKSSYASTHLLTLHVELTSFSLEVSYLDKAVGSLPEESLHEKGSFWLI